jgi:hypothetical protein
MPQSVNVNTYMFLILILSFLRSATDRPPITTNMPIAMGSVVGVPIRLLFAD